MITSYRHVNPIVRQRLSSTLIKLLRGSVEINKLNLIGLRNLSHRRRVELQIGVVHLGIGVVGVARLFLGNRRDQNNPWCPLPTIILHEHLLEILLQIHLEFIQSLRPLERFIKTPKRQHHIRLHFRQPLIRRRHPIRPHVRSNFIGGKSQIANGNVCLRVRLVNQGLQCAVVLHPISKPVPNNRNV